jgi:hypothetical protein
MGLAVLAAMGVSSAAQSASLSPDFHTMTPSAAVVRSGDFDGDGRVDQLYLVTEAETGRVAVHVRLDRADGIRDIRVTSLDVGTAAAPNLQVVPAGAAYAADCGTYSSDCRQGALKADHDSILLGLDGSTNVLIHWTGAKFDQDFVRGNDTLLAHAVAALYAVNP